MKEKRKILSIVTSVVLTTLFLSGCVSKPQEPDVTAKAYYDLVILGDSTELANIGVDTNEIEDLRQEQIDSVTDTFNSILASSESTLNEDKVKGLVNAIFDSCKKLNVTTEVVSKDEETATVKVSSNYIEIMKICEAEANNAIEEVQALNLTDINEAEEKYMNLYLDKAIAALKNAEPSSDVIEKEVELELKTTESNGKKMQIWMPENEYELGLEFGKMAMGVR